MTVFFFIEFPRTLRASYARGAIAAAKLRWMAVERDVTGGSGKLQTISGTSDR